METTVTIDDARPNAAETREKLLAADESLRKSFAGLPIDEVVPEIQRSLDEIGVSLPSSEVTAYAQHVSDRADHELVVA